MFGFSGMKSNGHGKGSTCRRCGYFSRNSYTSTCPQCRQTDLLEKQNRILKKNSSRGDEGVTQDNFWNENNSTINCVFCGYQIPSSAKICLHCDAKKVKVVDDSDIGCIIGAVKYGFCGGIFMGGIFLVQSWGHPIIGAILGAVIAGFVGYCTGDESEEWQR